MLPSSTTKMLNKEEEQVKKDEPIKPKSNSKPKRVWQKKVAPPLEAPPQKYSSSKSEPRYSRNELHKEESRSKDLKH